MEDTKLAKVLVVDDEPNIVELLTVSLKFQNFEVFSANSGHEALRVAREVNPDAYILDVMMPGMDGFELLGKLRQEGLDGPVLYLTAKDGVDQRIHGLTIGADDYVTKPFSLEEVITRLRVIMRRGGAAEESTNDATMSYADLTLNDVTHEVTKDGQIVEDLVPGRINGESQLLNKDAVDMMDVSSIRTPPRRGFWHGLPLAVTRVKPSRSKVSSSSRSRRILSASMAASSN